MSNAEIILERSSRTRELDRMDSLHPDGFRRIVHVDLDAFFASVEQRDDPGLRGRPVAVGGMRERSVVAAASYEARKFGVRSAMPAVTARRLCPDLVFVPPRFDVYREVSGVVQAIFREFADAVEPLSLDEAYLDVARTSLEYGTARAVAEEIRRRITQETELTASAGVSYCKFMAKVASDWRKPNGIFVIPPSRGAEFAAALPIGKFHGIGPATEARMKALGLNVGADLAARSVSELVAVFGKVGRHYHDIANGIDDRPVRADRKRKSAGAERTFDTDLVTLPAMLEQIPPLAAKAYAQSLRADEQGRRVTVKVKFSDFVQITRSRTIGPIPGVEEVEKAAAHILTEAYPFDRGVRLLGVSISGFANENEGASDSRQLDLGV